MKRIKIEVTERGIKDGIRKSTTLCPIANACRRNKDINKYNFRVNPIEISKIQNRPLINNTYDQFLVPLATLPKEASNFIIDFDGNLPVKPFSFEVDISD